MTSLNLIRDIFFTYHTKLSRISVFHADLPTIQRALDLHTIPHSDMNLVQCRRVLIHHIVAGACADYDVDASLTSPPDHSACCALCQDFNSPADMSDAVLKVIISGDLKQIPMEKLMHVAAALNIYIPGTQVSRSHLPIFLAAFHWLQIRTSSMT
jgi:hypothetical protein